MGQTVQQMIVAAAIAQGVDPNYALAVAQNESGFDQSAVSSKGAIGVFQLMPLTAQGLGVDPYSLDGNINGGITYLKQQLNAFGGDSYMAAAAYNAGPNGNWDNSVTTKYANDVVNTYGQYAGSDVAAIVAPSSTVVLDSTLGDVSWLPLAIAGVAVLMLAGK